jgi:hypothetical protein
MTTTAYLPRALTWSVLERTRNQAAINTLAAGLTSQVPGLRHRCIQALIVREELEAREAVLRHWGNYDVEDLKLLHAESRKFVEAVKSLFKLGSLPEKRAVLAAINDLDMTDSIDEILEIVVDQRHALCPQATQCLLEMCRRWGAHARAGKDVPSRRGPMLEKMYNKLAQFYEHKNVNLVDAWLSLAHWDDAQQRQLISDPRQAAYRCVLKQLRQSQRPAIVQLLAGYLLRSTTPTTVLDILCQRPEEAVAIEIAKIIDDQSLGAALKCLKRLPALESLKHIDAERNLSVGIELEKRLWLMVAASSNELGQVLRGALKLSKHGTRDARQTAASMLRRCRRPDLDTLVATLQAASLEETNPNHTGNVIRAIAAWLQSPSVALKKAAADFLQDFTIERLLDQSRVWPTQLCKAMAGIVMIAESNITEVLSRELQSPAPKRRLSALQAAQILGCVQEVSQVLLPLLEDPRLEIRVRTIDLLSALGHESLEQIIPALLNDASTDIQDAAGRAIRRMNRQPEETPQEA